MTTASESDIKELKQLIQQQTGQLTDIQKEIGNLQKELGDLKVSNGKIEATLQSQQMLIQKIPDLTEKVGELKNWKQIGLVFITAAISSIFTGTIGGVIGWLIRGSKI